MNTVERVKSICKERKIPISKLELALGFSNGYISSLKKGTIPGDRLKLIAEYLDLSVDFLITGIENKYDYLYKDENNDFLIEITNMMSNNNFVEKIKKYMTLSEENRKSIDDMIDFMYEKEKKDEI